MSALTRVIVLVRLRTMESHDRMRTAIRMIINFDYHIGSFNSRFQHLPIMHGIAQRACMRQRRIVRFANVAPAFASVGLGFARGEWTEAFANVAPRAGLGVADLRRRREEHPRNTHVKARDKSPEIRDLQYVICGIIFPARCDTDPRYTLYCPERPWLR